MSCHSLCRHACTCAEKKAGQLLPPHLNAGRQGSRMWTFVRRTAKAQVTNPMPQNEQVLQNSQVRKGCFLFKNRNKKNRNSRLDSGSPYIPPKNLKE